MKKLSLTLGLALACSASWAQTMLWQTDTTRHQYYRIPAIVANGKNVIAFVDNRSGVTDATSWGDVGSVGNISIEVRHSKDGGRTWTSPKCAVKGFGNGGYDQSHGDAAVVRDRETGRMLIMTGSGDVGYGRSKVTVPGDYSEALKVGRYYSDDNGNIWKGDLSDLRPLSWSWQHLPPFLHKRSYLSEPHDKAWRILSHLFGCGDQ